MRLLLPFTFLLTGLMTSSLPAQVPAPPVAPRRPHVTELHGERREDPWAWLRDREDPAVIRHLEAENAYTAAMTAHTAGLRERLYREMLGRIQETDLGVPVRRGEWFYYSRTEEGKAYPIYARKRGSLDAAEEVILDQNAEAEGQAYFHLGGMEVSPDHRHLAVLVDTTGYEDFEVFRDWVVVEERHEGLRRLRVERTADREVHYVAFPETAYGVYPGPNPEYDTGTLRFTYSSLVTPPSVFDYDLAARTRELKKEEPVLGGYDRTQYEVERLMVPARDGARVPVSLVRRKPFTRDGSRPLLLYGYGSYGYTLEPTFSSARLSLLDRGFTYAIAHVRGGQELGRGWYDAGKMMHKLNTFHDFTDVAEYLVRERYTSADRQVANGGSAGGLLMGAVANMRPDLFRAIVADVPFVDVINTMLDASIPLTAQEWEQWGNPAEREAYEYMRRYSPYDNVRAQAYPWMLVMSGINDPRVHYWEPAKWVAKLRALKTDRNPLLLRMEMESGHGGSSGRYERLKEQAFRYAFILDAVGLAQEAVP